MKQDNSVKLSEGDMVINYTYSNLEDLSKFKTRYMKSGPLIMVMI
jgi:hypothetical protein